MSPTRKTSDPKKKLTDEEYERLHGRRKPGRKPGPRPGSKNRPRVAREHMVTSVGSRKDPSELNDTHAAITQLYEDEKKLFETKEKLRARHGELTGKMPPPPPKPVHMLNGSTSDVNPSLSKEKAITIGASLCAIPSILGLETSPNMSALEQWSDSVVELSKHYQVDSIVMDWMMFVGATAALFAPPAVEFIARRAGNWEQVKQNMQSPNGSNVHFIGRSGDA